MPDAAFPSAVPPAPDEAFIRLDIAADVEDADPADAARELRLQEVAYRATVAVMSKALQPSLADFLR